MRKRERLCSISAFSDGDSFISLASSSAVVMRFASCHFQLFSLSVIEHSCHFEQGFLHIGVLEIDVLKL